MTLTPTGPIEVGEADVLGDLMAAGKLDDVPLATAPSVTIAGPASAALWAFQHLSHDGRRLYDELVEAAGVDVDALDPWEQYILVWLAGENKRLAEAFTGLLRSARQAAYGRTTSTTDVVA